MILYVIIYCYSNSFSFWDTKYNSFFGSQRSWYSYFVFRFFTIYIYICQVSLPEGLRLFCHLKFVTTGVTRVTVVGTHGPLSSLMGIYLQRHGSLRADGFVANPTFQTWQIVAMDHNSINEGFTIWLFNIAMV